MKMFKIIFLLIVITYVCLTYSSVIGGNLDSRIIGGSPANKNSWPFIVSVAYGKNFMCGASLIHPLWIITAAHCLPYNSTEEDKVIKEFGPVGVGLGPEDLDFVLLSQISIEKPNVDNYIVAVMKVVKIEKYFIHPDYKLCIITGAEVAVHDIALIKLPQNYKLPKSVKAIQLAATPVKDKSSCKAAGWGVNEYPNIYINSSNKNLLYELELVIDLQKCEEIKNKANSVLQNAANITLQHILCTKARILNETVFKGDSGGPVICNNKLQGVISTVTGKVSGSQVYLTTIITDVIPYTKWIYEVIGSNEADKRTLKNNTPSYHNCTVIISLVNLIYLLSRIS